MGIRRAISAFACSNVTPGFSRAIPRVAVVSEHGFGAVPALGQEEIGFAVEE
jgi:hypothetical protein